MYTYERADCHLQQLSSALSSLPSTDFFQNHLFKNSFSNRCTIRVSKSLDPDQARHFVRPDLGTNCLHRLSADDKRHH